MTMQKLASELAKQEGKSHQASIGDIREILKLIAEMEAKWTLGTYPESPLDALYEASDAKVRKAKAKEKT